MKHIKILMLFLMLSSVSYLSAVEFETYFHDIKDSTEIVFVMDTSASLFTILPGLVGSARDFMDAVEDSGYFCRFGGVTFADGTRMWDFNDTLPGYQMTSNSDDFMYKLTNAGSMGGGDYPECAIDAMYDAACEYDWTEGTLRILLMTTDAPSHYPDDGSPYSDVTDDELEDFLLDNGFILYTVLADSFPYDSLLLGYPNDSVYFHISDTTGGRRYGPETDWDTVFTDIITDISALYRIGLRISGLSGHELYEVEIVCPDEFSTVASNIIDLTDERYVGVDEIYVAWVMRFSSIAYSATMLPDYATFSFILQTSEGEFTYDETIDYTPPALVYEKTLSNPKEISIHTSPNPFNTSTSIEFYIPEQGHAKLEIVDIAGHTVATLLDDDVNSGSYVSVWSAKDVPSGVYLVKLNWNGFTASQKLLLTK